MRIFIYIYMSDDFHIREDFKVCYAGMKGTFLENKVCCLQRSSAFVIRSSAFVIGFMKCSLFVLWFISIICDETIRIERSMLKTLIKFLKFFVF